MGGRVSAAKKGPETVRQLAGAPYNPRTISEKRAAQLAKSMEKFGDLSSITFNRRTGRLVSGHQRVKHLQPNARIDKKPVLNDPRGTVATGTIVSGRNLWPYREVDWDEATEKAANIAANAGGGSFDDPKLSKIVRELDGLGVDLDVLNLDSIEELLAEPDADTGSGADATPAAGEAPFVKRGEVWLLGEHRLMCGDSTSRRDVERLVAGEPADLVFTDPPYGVSFKSEGNEFDVIKGDDKRDDDLYQLVAQALKRAVEVARDTAAFYVWHASSTRREFEDALRDAGLSERQYLIWVKNAIVLGHADYQWGHEPCFYAAKAGQRPAWHGDRAQPTVWRVTLKARGKAATTLGTALTLTDGAGGGLALVPRLPKGKKARSARLAVGESLDVELASDHKDVWEVERDDPSTYIHPTQKPVELAVIALKNSTKPGQVVLDLFGGSGSTLMGAEATGRRARLMELDELHASPIVRRWEEATGRKATREDVNL